MAQLGATTAPSPKIISSAKVHPFVTVPTATPPLPTPAGESIILHGSREQRRIAFTFDADMTPHMRELQRSGKVKTWYNAQIIEILRQSKTPATLFLTGMWIELYPQEAASLAGDPLFELGNHSYSHPSFQGYCYGLTRSADSQDEAEINLTQLELYHLTHKFNTLFRFPGGCSDTTSQQNVTKAGLQAIGWDVAGGDGYLRSTVALEQNVLSQVKNGSIIVLHLHGGPFAPKTAEALPMIITNLKLRGFTFVTVSQLLHL